MSICKASRSCLAPESNALLNLHTFDLNVVDLINTLLIHALAANIAPFNLSHARSSLLGLPRRRANVRQSVGIFEDELHLLESLASSLGEEEGDVNQHAEVENTEDNVHLPTNGFERRGNERSQCGVECPVGGCSKCDGFAADA